MVKRGNFNRCYIRKPKDSFKLDLNTALQRNFKNAKHSFFNAIRLSIGVILKPGKWSFLTLALISIASFGDAAAQLRSELLPVGAFRSGGIGREETRQMRRAARAYNVELIFATPTGQYIAGVKFEVKDSAGRSLVAGQDVGPIVLMNLEGGWYVITASHAGVTQRKRVLVRHGAHRIIFFRWPIQKPPGIHR